jgi:hypothetical protein
MTSKAVLTFPDKVDVGDANDAVVTVTGAVHGDRVTMWVEQREGGKGVAITAQKVAKADGAGGASAVFQGVVLATAGTVVLVAQASDSQGPHFDLTPLPVQVT